MSNLTSHVTWRTALSDDAPARLNWGSRVSTRDVSGVATFQPCLRPCSSLPKHTLASRLDASSMTAFLNTCKGLFRGLGQMPPAEQQMDREEAAREGLFDKSNFIVVRSDGIDEDRARQVCAL